MAACLLAHALTSAAHAQALPGSDAANYAALQQRLPNSGDAEITNDALAAAAPGTKPFDIRYHVDNPSIALPNLSPAGILATTGRTADQLLFFDADTNVGGALIGAAYAGFAAFGVPNRFAVTLYCRSNLQNQPPLPVIDPKGNIHIFDPSDYYGVTFTGNNYAASYNAYQAYLRDNGTPTGYTGSARPTSAEFRQSVYECGIPGNPDNPLVGTSESLQSRMIDDALNLADPGPATMPDLALDTSEWGVGLRVGRVATGDRSGVQVDGIVNRSWRIGHANRALVTLEVPFNYRDLAGQRQWRVYAALSATLPLRRWWSLTPRVAYGHVDAIDQEIRGQILATTLTNSFFVDHFLGRGSLTFATLAGFSRVMHMDYLGRPIGTRTSNYAFRNGLAYEYPLSDRLLGRQASLRTSYAFTVYGGDDLYGRWMHEVTASFGVRKRGTDVRNRFESFRIGLIGRFARNANSEHVFIGVRF